MENPTHGGHQTAPRLATPIPAPALAVALAGQGFSCFPCNGKKPLLAWAMYQRQAPSPSSAQSWWQSTPKANVALVTGALNNLTVVDVDGCGHSPAVMEKVQNIFGPTPMVVFTPGKGGGLQLYYAHQGERNTAWELPEHSLHGDIRGEGGYVMAPGSFHPEALKNYLIEQDLSGFLGCLRVLPHPRFIPAPKPAGGPQTNPPTQNRNEWLSREARKAAPTAESLESLKNTVRGINQTLPVPLGEDEVASTSQSAWKYKISGKLILPGEERWGRVFVSELKRITPNEAYLLLHLRTFSGHRTSFAIGQDAVSKLLGWGKVRLRDAIRGLVSAGMLVVIKQGGTTKGDVTLYAWGKRKYNEKRRGLAG